VERRCHCVKRVCPFERCCSLPDMPNVPIPFAEPPYIQGLPSPYYSPSHRQWQKKCRAFMEEHVEEHASEWERDGLVPTHLWDTFNKHNMLVPNLPCPLPVEVLHKAGIRDVLGIRVEDFYLLHVCIYWDEMARFGSVYASMSAGMTYAISPIIKYGSPKLQKQFLRSADWQKTHMSGRDGAFCWLRRRKHQYYC